LNPRRHFHVASTFQITDMSSVQPMVVSETDTTLTHMVTFNCIPLKFLPVYYVSSQSLNPRRPFHVKSRLQIVGVSSVRHKSVSETCTTHMVTLNYFHFLKLLPYNRSIPVNVNIVFDVPYMSCFITFFSNLEHGFDF
jgi:hypothetical protein